MQSQESHRLHKLEVVLQEQLKQHAFILPTGIWCIVRARVLIIILDYASAISPVEQQRCVRDIHQALLLFTQKYASSLKSYQFGGHVRCYWRTMNAANQLVGSSFTFREWLPVLAKTAPELVCSHAEVDASVPGGESISVSPTTAFHAVQAPSTTQSPCSNSPRLKRSSRQQDQPNSSASLSLLSFVRLSGLTKYWKWGIGLSGILALAITGLGGYAWSRPCVSDTCPILDRAEALRPSLEISDAASVEDVSQAYTTLLDVNYQLSKVPFWSPHYTEVKTLLVTYENHAHQVSRILGAQQQADDASVASQSPPYPLQDLETIQQQWQQAIQTLEPVVEETIVSPLAQTKLKEYEGYLQSVELRITQEKKALEKIQDAREAAQVADIQSSTIGSIEHWKNAVASWNTALSLLNDVSADSMAYAEAEHLKAIYYPQMLAVQDQLKQEILAQKLYEKAIALAEISVRFEQEEQWTSAVKNWQAALESVNQVAENTSYYDQVVPLVSSYTAALANAQYTLKRAMAVQQAQKQLIDQCQSIDENLCSSVTYEALAIKVWLGAQGDQTIENAISYSASTDSVNNTKTSVDAVPHSGANNMGELVRVIASIGQTMQVSIALHGSDGKSLGTYVPEKSSYLPASELADHDHLEESTAVSVSEQP